MLHRASSLFLATGLVGVLAAPAGAWDVSLAPPDTTLAALRPKAPMMGHGHMMGGRGRMGHGPMMYRKMRQHIQGHYWRGPEFVYQTGMGLSGGALAANPVGQYLDVGNSRRFEFNDFLALGFTGHLAYQLFPATGQGSWVVPYCGIVPRLGFTLGPVRFDVGAMAGLGGMVRTTGADFLQARTMWLLEPNAELSLRSDHMSVGLRGGYMLSPNPADFGGLTAGLRVGFGGYYADGKAQKKRKGQMEHKEHKDPMKGSEPTQPAEPSDDDNEDDD